MSEPSIPTALLDKRAELSSELHQVQQRVLQLRTDLDGVDHTIRLFDSAWVPSEHRKKPMLPPGKLSGGVLDTLRTAQAPMTAREIATKIAADWHLEMNDRLLLAVRNILARKREGLVVERRDDGTLVWRVGRLAIAR